MASSEDTLRVRILTGPTAVLAFMRDADDRLMHVLSKLDARLNAEERHQLEEAAQSLRAALRCMDPG
jgi:uncharacterized protein YbgA (DUF1722 family)